MRNFQLTSLAMIRRSFLRSALSFALASSLAISAWGADHPKRKILFFTKSSGWEHDVISWKKGKPSFAEKVLLDLGAKNNWEFTFSKDGSLFSPEYLAQFDALVFYTTGNLLEPGTDKEPAMTVAGKQALLDAVKNGKGFVGIHSAADTFHTDNESNKGPERYKNHGDAADDYVKMLGSEFIKHGAQQIATMRVTDPAFPGFAALGNSFDLNEEWYSLKEFSKDLHVLLVQEAEKMKGIEYQRPAYPATWSRMHGKGHVFYTSMGHREDVWTNPTFQNILVGGINWSMGDAFGSIAPNLNDVAPKANELPPYPGDAKPTAGTPVQIQAPPPVAVPATPAK